MKSLTEPWAPARADLAPGTGPREPGADKGGPAGQQNEKGTWKAKGMKQICVSCLAFVGAFDLST